MFVLYGVQRDKKKNSGWELLALGSGVPSFTFVFVTGEAQFSGKIPFVCILAEILPR